MREGGRGLIEECGWWLGGEGQESATHEGTRGSVPDKLGTPRSRVEKGKYIHQQLGTPRFRAGMQDRSVCSHDTASQPASISIPSTTEPRRPRPCPHNARTQHWMSSNVSACWMVLLNTFVVSLAAVVLCRREMGVSASTPLLLFLFVLLLLLLLLLPPAEEASGSGRGGGGPSEDDLSLRTAVDGSPLLLAAPPAASGDTLLADTPPSAAGVGVFVEEEVGVVVAEPCGSGKPDI